MPEYTRDDLEVEVSKALGDYFSFAATANGGSSGEYITCSTLREHPSNSFSPFLAEVTSGARDGDRRLVARTEPADPDVVGTPSTLYPFNAFGGQILSGVTFRLHRIHPQYKEEALREVLVTSRLVIPNILTEDFIAGDLLRNGGMEHWRSLDTPADWGIVNGTIVRSTAQVRQGLYSLAITGTLGATGRVRQRIPLEAELNGVALTLACYVYGTASANIIVRLSQGGTNGDSSALGASDAWTLLTATLTPSDSVQPIYAELRNLTAVITYFDFARLYPGAGNSVSVIPVTEMFRNVHQVQLGPLSTAPRTTFDSFSKHLMPDRYERGYGWYDSAGHVSAAAAEISSQLRTGYHLPLDYHMRLLGEGRYMDFESGTDALELTIDERDFIAAKAGLRALQKAKDAGHVNDTDHYDRTFADLTSWIAELTTAVRRVPPPFRYAPWN